MATSWDDVSMTSRCINENKYGVKSYLQYFYDDCDVGVTCKVRGAHRYDNLVTWCICVIGIISALIGGTIVVVTIFKPEAFDGGDFPTPRHFLDVPHERFFLVGGILFSCGLTIATVCLVVISLFRIEKKKQKLESDNFQKTLTMGMMMQEREFPLFETDAEISPVQPLTPHSTP
ncbi:uncharacterized protein LOC100184996 [Ciona intestinalis]